MGLKKGQRVFVTKENPKINNTPTGGTVHQVHDKHVVLRTVGGTGLYKVPKHHVSDKREHSWLRKKYRAESLDESLTTKPDPTGAPGVHHVYKNGNRLVNVSIINPHAGVVGGTGRGKQQRSYHIHLKKSDKYIKGFRSISHATGWLQQKMRSNTNEEAPTGDDYITKIDEISQGKLEKVAARAIDRQQHYSAIRRHGYEHEKADASKKEQKYRRIASRAYDKMDARVGRDTDNPVKVPASEEVAVNNAGGGAIAAIGIGPDGEPGVRRKAQARYKKASSQPLKRFSSFKGANVNVN